VRVPTRQRGAVGARSGGRPGARQGHHRGTAGAERGCRVSCRASGDARRAKHQPRLDRGQSVAPAPNSTNGVGRGETDPHIARTPCWARSYPRHEVHGYKPDEVYRHPPDDPGGPLLLPHSGLARRAAESVQPPGGR
jgi:hypothetical protein